MWRLDGLYMCPGAPGRYMGYHVVDPSELPRSPDHPCDRRSISEAVGLRQVAVARYELSPGEQLPTTYHYHEQREEFLYVLDGTLHVETPGQEYVVDDGEAFVVEPESPHRAFNPEGASDPVTVLGAGAPAFDAGRPYEGEETSDVDL